MSKLGALIKKRRTNLGFTLRDIEKVTSGKISNGYLCQLENGKIKNPSVKKLLLLSHALFLSISELLSEID